MAASVGLGALAAADVVSGVIGDPAEDKLRFISLNASYSWANKTDIDDGCEFGLAHSDYTAAEIEECLEAQGAIDLGDKVAQEQANRLVRSIGTISGPSAPAAAGGIQWNDGRQHKVRLNWLMAAGDQLQLWMRNGSSAVYTTGSSITAQGDLWVKD